jgi:hypothetical protein
MHFVNWVSPLYWRTYRIFIHLYNMLNNDFNSIQPLEKDIVAHPLKTQISSRFEFKFWQILNSNFSIFLNQILATLNSNFSIF